MRFGLCVALLPAVTVTLTEQRFDGGTGAAEIKLSVPLRISQTRRGEEREAKYCPVPQFPKGKVGRTWISGAPWLPRGGIGPGETGRAGRSEGLGSCG